MFSHDKSGFKQILIDFYKQLDEVENIVQAGKLNIDRSAIKNILYLGMGSSAISGDLLYDLLFQDLEVPLNVVRGYEAPKFCSKNTLVIASSYSGNTEETLHAANQVKDKGAQFIAITSGGVLYKTAQYNKWNILKLPEGFPPRQALGFIFFSLYHALGQIGLFSSYKKDLTDFKSFVTLEIAKHHGTIHAGHILAQEIAKTLHNKIPIVYSTAPVLLTVARRWQNQLNENSKSLAFSNVIPEMNHNEIVGWEMDPETRKSLVAVFLETEITHPRIKERIDLSKKIIKRTDTEIVDVYSSGKTNLECAFSLIILADWVSYYLAMFNQKDPHNIRNIDYLKSELEKTV